MLSNFKDSYHKSNTEEDDFDSKDKSAHTKFFSKTIEMLCVCKSFCFVFSNKIAIGFENIKRNNESRYHVVLQTNALS